MAKEYSFDPESGTFVPLENIVVGPEDDVDETAFLLIEGEEESDDIPGGTAAGVLHPPETFSVISQTVRLRPGSSSVVDVLIEVDDGMDLNEYEVRLTK